mmetsp:Transcript_2816/g.3712  ORF Transcript_2816/g.3712 Transcript_2816/m.3712 type:complete len:85 (+) Transcript_2816:2454-2708(+)
MGWFEVYWREIAVQVVELGVGCDRELACGLIEGHETFPPAARLLTLILGWKTYCRCGRIKAEGELISILNMLYYCTLTPTAWQD